MSWVNSLVQKCPCFIPCLPISNLSEFISMPIILVAPHSLAPSATYRSFSKSIRAYTIIDIYNQEEVGGETYCQSNWS